MASAWFHVKVLLEKYAFTSRREVIKPLENPYSKTGGVAILHGNLAPLGAVVKPAAVPPQLMVFRGPAQVFHSEDHAVEEILNGNISQGTTFILRYEGPKGGPGMPEMYRPMKHLEGMGLSDSCVLITDGRFSGSNRGCFVGHISPEAYEGAPLPLSRKVISSILIFQIEFYPLKFPRRRFKFAYPNGFAQKKKSRMVT